MWIKDYKFKLLGRIGGIILFVYNYYNEGIMIKGVVIFYLEKCQNILTSQVLGFIC